MPQLHELMGRKDPNTTWIDEFDDLPSLSGYSNCCSAPVYGETDICSDCKEHCVVMSSTEEFENESD